MNMRNKGKWFLAMAVDWFQEVGKDEVRSYLDLACANAISWELYS